jgi:hypothetical protein
MVRIILITATILFSTQARSQDDEFTGYKGILSSTATFSAGYNTPFKSVNYFLQGNLEYQIDERISVRSDVFYFLGSNTPSDPIEPFKSQHGLFTGAQYHFLKGRLDYYAGLQPGLVLCQRQYYQHPEGIAPVEAPQKSVAAVFSVNTGINYYASKFFLLFFQVRYNTGWFSDNYSVASLNEIRASFGLGFYIKLKKKSAKDL